MILKDDFIYSTQSVMTKHFAASYGVLQLMPDLNVIVESTSSDAKMDMTEFSDAQKREIREFATSYTERVLFTGNERTLWAIIPSLFPASSFCAVLKFNIPTAEVLRLIREADPESFVVSPLIEVRAARMTSRVEAKRDMLSDLFDSIRECFCDIYRLDRCESEDERTDILKRQCYALSYFCGCPIELSVEDRGNGFSRTDLPVLSAFLYTMLTSARNNAPRREAQVRLLADGKGVSATVEFEGDPLLCLSPEQLEWTKVGNNKGMFISFSFGSGRVSAELRPVIDDTVYSEIKQRFAVK